MAGGSLPSYAQWMQQNPDLVQQVQQRYTQPAQPAPEPAPVTPAPAPAPAPQAAPAQPAKAQQVQPVALAQQFAAGAQAQPAQASVGSSVSNPQQPDKNIDAMKIAGIIASIYTGGAASGALAAAGSGGK